MHFFKWKCLNFDKDFTEVGPKGPINNIPALVHMMAWRRPGDKLLSEPMSVSLLTHICVTRPQWVYFRYHTIPVCLPYYGNLGLSSVCKLHFIYMVGRYHLTHILLLCDDCNLVLCDDLWFYHTYSICLVRNVINWKQTVTGFWDSVVYTYYRRITRCSWPWINHLPRVWWSTFRLMFKWQIACNFSIVERKFWLYQDFIHILYILYIIYKYILHIIHNLPIVFL